MVSFSNNVHSRLIFVHGVEDNLLKDRQCLRHNTTNLRLNLLMNSQWS